MRAARSGDRVRVHYTGRFPDGTTFDSSEGGEPLEFTLGTGWAIPGFEEAVQGLQPGESRSVWVTADQAYGPHREDLMLVVDRCRFPPHIEPEPGQRLQMRREGHPAVLVTVAEVDEEDVLLDGNHPLAGRDLTFDLQLVEIIERAAQRQDAYIRF